MIICIHSALLYFITKQAGIIPALEKANNIFDVIQRVVNEATEAEIRPVNCFSTADADADTCEWTIERARHGALAYKSCIDGIDEIIGAIADAEFHIHNAIG